MDYIKCSCLFCKLRLNTITNFLELKQFVWVLSGIKTSQNLLLTKGIFTFKERMVSVAF